MIRPSLFALTLAVAAGTLRAQAPPAGTTTPFVVEYYYTAQWGHADEFIRLFKKNHFPVLKRRMELGDILQITVEAPRFHATEDGYAGIQQLAHDTNLLFYANEEAQEGRDAYREKRRPDFTRFPRRA